jgi:hypothetical protein
MKNSLFARRALVAVTAAGVLAAGTTFVPTKAHAIAEWVIPAIIGSAVGGTILGAGAASRDTVVVQPPPPAYAAPPLYTAPPPVYRVPACQTYLEVLPGGYQREVTTCN